MTLDLMLAASLFIVVSSITPGPNNTMLMASGVNFGFRRSLRHLAGVNIGFSFMVLCVGLGLHTVLQDSPMLYNLLRIVGASYMLWIAFQLVRTAPATPATTVSTHHSFASRPMGFWGAAAFQWVNPKAWFMAVTCMGTYLEPQAGWMQVALLAGMFILLGSPCSAFWVGSGQVMRRWLQQPAPRRLFNWAMAGALVVSLYPMISP